MLFKIQHGTDNMGHCRTRRTLDPKSLQGKTVLENLDLFAHGGGVNRGVVREFKGVAIDGTLSVTLEAIAGRAVISGVEVIAEP